MAWERVRIIGCSLREALKYAWNIAKTAARAIENHTVHLYEALVKPYPKSTYANIGNSLQQVVIAKKVLQYIEP